MNYTVTIQSRNVHGDRSRTGARDRFDRRSADSAALLRLFRVTDAIAPILLSVAILLLSRPTVKAQGLVALLDATVPLRALLVFGPLAALYVLAFQLFGMYDRRPVRPFGEVTEVVVACTVGTLPLAVTNRLTQWLGIEELVFFWCGSIALTSLARRTLREIVRARREEAVRETIIVGSGPQALSLYRRLSQQPTRRILGFVDSTDALDHAEISERWLGSLEEFDRILMMSVVDEVIVALPVKSRYEQIQTVIHSCERAGVECTYSACVFQRTLARPRLEPDELFPAVRMQVVEHERRWLMKRPIDIVGAASALVLGLPVIVAVAVAVAVTSPGPIFFVQERYGYRKRRFKMYKFRTMVANAEATQHDLESLNEATGHAFKIRNDPRLTPLGSFLRRWSLDEIPQFLNVLKGDMSLVGPRPLSIRDVNRFSEGWLMRRFSVRPGLTCLWQIKGRANLSFDEWINLDLQYIDRWSPLLDVWILLMTVPSVLKRTGAV
jgi:exopolysaccharide biosynthesis polyprenyl glycosylphosphotransferase